MLYLNVTCYIRIRHRYPLNIYALYNNNRRVNDENNSHISDCVHIRNETITSSNHINITFSTEDKQQFKPSFKSNQIVLIHCFISCVFWLNHLNYMECMCFNLSMSDLSISSFAFNRITKKKKEKKINKIQQHVQKAYECLCH